MTLAPVRVSARALAALTVRGERQGLTEGDRPEGHDTAQEMILFDAASACLAAARGTGWRRWFLTLLGATS